MKRNRAVSLIVIILIAGGVFVFFQGNGVIVGSRENQNNIDLEIGLWTPHTIIEQTFLASMDNLCRIDFRVDSYHPWDSPYLDCRLFEINADEHVFDLTYEFLKNNRKEIRSKRLNGWAISGHMFNRFSFPPIPSSKHKRYLFSIQSPGLKQGGTSILSASPTDRYPYYGRLFVNGKAQEGDLAFRVLYSQPRRQVMQQSFEKIALQKPSLFSKPGIYDLLILSYIALLIAFFFSLPGLFERQERNSPCRKQKNLMLTNMFALLWTRKKLYLEFFVLYTLLPFSYGIIGIKKLWMFFHRSNGRTPQRLSILVIQLQKIGDLVCTTPIFRELRTHYPRAHITAMVLPFTADILKNNPHVDEIITYDAALVEGSAKETIRFIRKLKKHRFDWSLNFSPNFRNIVYVCLALIPKRIGLRSPYVSGMTKAVYWTHSRMKDYNSRTSAMKAYLETLQFIGISEYTMQKEVYINPDDLNGVNRFLEEHGIHASDIILALHPFAGVRMKEWGREKFIALAERLIDQYNAKILLIGSSHDREEAWEMQNQSKYNLINTCGEFTLAQLPALLERAQLFISVDTGPLYIANAIGVPVVNIAGPCDLNTQKPDGRYEIVRKPLDCAPCSFIMNAPRVCQRGDRKCLELITVDDVLTAVRDLRDQSLKR